MKGIMTEFGRSWLDSDGYMYVSRKINNKWSSKPYHLLVYEASYGKVEPGMQVHHIDHDHTNNAINNLIALSCTDHRRHHAGWKQDTNGLWISKKCSDCKEEKLLSDYCRSGNSYQIFCKPCDNKRRSIRAKKKRLEHAENQLNSKDKAETLEEEAI